jgi:hypothetical protein
MNAFKKAYQNPGLDTLRDEKGEPQQPHHRHHIKKSQITINPNFRWASRHVREDLRGRNR